MSADRKAIPTLYRGVQYRSRLEARWGAFFTIMGWSFEYEPFDLEGWIPDFALTGGEKPLLVEVKPIFLKANRPKDVIAKIDATSWAGNVMIIGCEIGNYYHNSVSIGWIKGELYNGVREYGPWLAWAGIGSWKVWNPVYRESKTVIGITPALDGEPRNLIGPGVGHFWLESEYVHEAVHSAWKRAGNAVQWRGKSSEAS